MSQRSQRLLPFRPFAILRSYTVESARVAPCPVAQRNAVPSWLGSVDLDASRSSLRDEVEYSPVPGQMATIFWLFVAASSRMSLSVTLINAAHVRDQHLRRAAEVHILEGVIADDHRDQRRGGCALASTPSIPTERHPAARVSASLLMNLTLIMHRDSLHSWAILHLAK